MPPKSSRRQKDKQSSGTNTASPFGLSDRGRPQTQSLQPGQGGNMYGVPSRAAKIVAERQRPPPPGRLARSGKGWDEYSPLSTPEPALTDTSARGESVEDDTDGTETVTRQSTPSDEGSVVSDTDYMRSGLKGKRSLPALYSKGELSRTYGRFYGIDERPSWQEGLDQKSIDDITRFNQVSNMWVAKLREYVEKTNATDLVLKLIELVPRCEERHCFLWRVGADSRSIEKPSAETVLQHLECCGTRGVIWNAASRGAPFCVTTRDDPKTLFGWNVRQRPEGPVTCGHLIRAQDWGVIEDERHLYSEPTEDSSVRRCTLQIPVWEVEMPDKSWEPLSAYSTRFTDADGNTSVKYYCSYVALLEDWVYNKESTPRSSRKLT
ncbi:hypothetical protein I302_108005 [Kwoniella bestiolae CBS 10118]|uniref:Uncharacterized protein n=1 Tax=Kwoniella bestiolae CBS 10118 TaxID=1296100 RepID=A0A1B9FWX3_9TREE|nr:hypothetical protein I302_07630 [Kwoniella bestiolae CBS 10118]OCF23276.1 hypothetical protein I302_07630 [Kwoniella bestiolae CBS 10118]